LRASATPETANRPTIASARAREVSLRNMDMILVM
jgi:hypothetical protein